MEEAETLFSFNLTINVFLRPNYILSPGPFSSAKYCNGENELFAKLDLTCNISEDTSDSGGMILNNCSN